MKILQIIKMNNGSSTDHVMNGKIIKIRLEKNRCIKKVHFYNTRLRLC